MSAVIKDHYIITDQVKSVLGDHAKLLAVHNCRGSNEHLSIVRAYEPNKPQWIVWTFNHQTKGLSGGSYLADTRHSATEFNRRIRLYDKGVVDTTVKVPVTENQLTVLAFHVKTIVESQDGDRFGLSFDGGLEVSVENREGQIYFDGQCQGNPSGAIGEYTRRVHLALGPAITT